MIFVLLLSVVAAVGCEGAVHGVYTNRMRQKEYDYIVVGAGSSGAIVASRLSEDESTSVLLLEAGGVPSAMSDVPLLGIYVVGTEEDWSYYSEPQKHACLALKNKQAFLPRGKVLGGSSSINSMLYVRGDRRDFDEWAKGGATGWSWDEVLHYFKKLEDYVDPELAESDIHGTGGPLTITVSDYESELGGAILNAAREYGYDIVDINGESPLGFTKVHGSVREGRRWGTEKGYLRPAASRGNLDILHHAHVTKVLFTEDKRAYGVRFEQGDSSHVVRARKEVVLSAGAFGTPQILMLSGVGPKHHLHELGIPVVADLPVGENLQDHVMVASHSYQINSSIGLIHSRVVNPDTVAQFLENKGPLTVPLGVEAMACLNTKYQDPSEQWPDLRLFTVSVLQLPPIADEGAGKVQYYSKDDGLTILPMVARPKSVGYIRLRSTNPYDHIFIEPNYLTHDYDVDVLVEGFKVIEELVKKPSLARYNPTKAIEVAPGCENMDTKSDEYYRCMARSLTITGYHQCGTAKMGNPEDPTTVVDQQLRVKGVSGLRIADASIMPAVTSGNTNAPCLMIGEKAADLIRGRQWDPVQKKIVPTK